METKSFTQDKRLVIGINWRTTVCNGNALNLLDR